MTEGTAATRAHRDGRRVEVSNLGRPGLQPKDSLQRLADEGMPLHLDLDAPARGTRARLEGRGITVVDLLPALSAAERDGNTFATRDSHWNERGNEVGESAYDLGYRQGCPDLNTHPTAVDARHERSYGPATEQSFATGYGDGFSGAPNRYGAPRVRQWMRQDSPDWE